MFNLKLKVQERADERYFAAQQLLCAWYKARRRQRFWAHLAHHLPVKSLTRLADKAQYQAEQRALLLMFQQHYQHAIIDATTLATLLDNLPPYPTQHQYTQARK